MPPETPPPLISVVMPVYNCAPYLRAAVDSILNQTFGDFELIALDDGSTDDSKAILEDMARADARINVVSHANRGMIETLNRGVRMARGMYIGRMDADDISLLDRFEKQITVLQSDPGIVALSTGFILTDPDGRKLRNVAVPKPHAQIDAMLMQGAAGVGICHAAAIIRKDALEQVGLYHDAFVHAEDRDIFLRLAEVGELQNLDVPLYLYRQHLKSVSYQHQHIQRMSAWNAISEASARRGIPFTLPEPTSDQSEGDVSEIAVLRRFGWWAVSDGYIDTARHYAARLVKNRPFSGDTWRLVYCALRGR